MQWGVVIMQKGIKKLFRQEAIDHGNLKAYGVVSLARPANTWLLVAVSMLTALSIILFFVFFSTTRKVAAQGVLVPTTGLVRIVPLQSGMVRERHVNEGQEVKKGDVLFVLSSERESTSDTSAEVIVSKLLTKRRDSFDSELLQSNVMLNQRIDTLNGRVKDLKLELSRTSDQIVLQQRRVDLAEKSYERYLDLAKTGFMSEAQVQDKLGDVLDQRQRVADLVRIQTVTQRDLASTMADSAALKLQSDRDNLSLARERSILEQDMAENDARREVVIRAPHDGVITAIVSHQGQMVPVGGTLASILPAKSELEAEVYIPSRSIGFVAIGMAVKLRYPAYPYQKFGHYHAYVKEISATSLRQDEIANLPSSNSNEPLYRVKLKLNQQSVLAYGRSMPLKSGMTVDANITLEKRRLYEWVLEPLFTISGRL